MPAFFIVTEQPIDGFDLFGNGEALAFASDLLDRIATDAGVRPLMDFFSMEPAELDTLFEMLGLDAAGQKTPSGTESASGAVLPPAPPPEAEADVYADADADEPPPEVWFQPREGLATVQALITALTEQPDVADPDAGIPATSEILTDLREFEAVLIQLAADGIRWHLMVEL